MTVDRLFTVDWKEFARGGALHAPLGEKLLELDLRTTEVNRGQKQRRSNDFGRCRFCVDLC